MEKPELPGIPHREAVSPLMPTTVQEVYTQVTKIFLEDVGFDAGTGMITDSMFFTALGDVMSDFMDRTNCVKKIINIPIQVGVSTYVEPEVVCEVQSASQNQTFIYRDSGFFLDSQDPNWTSEFNQPAKWREDENPPLRIQLTPAPNVDGWQVAVSLPQQGYGTISSTSGAVDFDIIADVGVSGYGTISSAPNGAVYLETLNQGYGLIASMVSSTGNLQLISAVDPYNETQTYLLDYLELIPDSFVPGIVYGVAAKLFSADSEAKDNQRAKYCASRYQFMLSLVGSVLDETSFEDGEQP